jgi:5'-deoxynucleotidase
MESHFYAYMYRLRYIQRWSLMRNSIKENVAEHSFHVAIIAHSLCTIANSVFHRNIPVDRVVTLAIFHDATEVITGDIPTPVKHHNPQILANFREIEHLASERLMGMIPDQLKSTYHDLLLETDKELLKWVKAADLIDAKLKCIMEEAAGNKEFTVAHKQIDKSIQLLQMPEVDYFLTHMAPSFAKTIDEIS